MLNVAQTNPVYDIHNKEQGNKEIMVCPSNPTPSGVLRAQNKPLSIYTLPELYQESSQETVKDAVRKLSIQLDFSGILLICAVKSQMENISSLILVLIEVGFEG